jgi:general secretion pathway protein A
MHKEFYNIKTEPFSTLPSPTVFYDSGTHQDAWEYLVQGINSREPYLLVTGDHGTGKTLLCLKLAQELHYKKCPCVYIPVPVCSYAALLTEIAAQLSIKVAVPDEAAIQHAVCEHFKYLSKDSCIYILLDDAQEIELPTLKKLLLLANFNYHEVFPVKFALFAHNSFIDQLAVPDLTILNYKLKQRFRLACLDLHETKEYIYFRLLKAEAPGIPAFTEDAINKIYAYSNGVPQLINKICDVCLAHGAARKLTIIEAPLVAEAKKDIDIGNSERKTESKVPLVQESQGPKPSIETYHKEPEAVEDTINNRMLNTIRNLTAILIFSLIFFFSALAVMSFLQYRFITSFKNIASEFKTVTQPAPDKQPPQVSTTTAPEEKSLLNEDRETSTIAPLPATTSMAISSAELTTSVPAGDNGTIPEDTDQQTTSIFPAYKSDETSTTIPETATSTAPAKINYYPFTMQLACYNSLEGAKERIVLFKKTGLSPYLVRSLSRQTGELYWVIYAGYYKTLEEGEQAKKLYSLDYAIVTKTPYANLVGVYAKPEEMTDMIMRLEKSEHFPYAIEENKNVYRLYVGAFTTRQGAEKLHDQLNAMGINAVIEER